MAYGTTTDFAVTRDELIAGALRLCGVLDPSESASTTEKDNAAEALNMMIKSWMADGLHVWTISEAHLFLEDGKEYYDIGTSGDHACYSPVFRYLDADAAIGDTEITITSGDATISVSDNIGIVCDDNTIHWTTVGAITGEAVTVDDAFTSSASDGNNIYIYTSKISRPIRVHSARVSIGTPRAGTEVSLNRLSENQYKEIPDKYTSGRPVSFWYDPQIDTLGQMYLWPVPNDVEEYIKFTYQFPFYDFDSANDNPHFPIEWAEALKFNLAVRISPEYGVSIEERAWLKREAEDLLAKLLTWDREPGSIYIYPLIKR